LYEAAALGVAEFRRCCLIDALPGPVTMLSVAVDSPSTRHEVPMRKLTAWLESSGRSPREQAIRLHFESGYISGGNRVMAARVTIKAVNDELARLGYESRLEKASCYFCFWTGEASGWLDATGAGGQDQRAHARAVGRGVQAAEETQRGDDALAEGHQEGAVDGPNATL
jgi:hypothetical protein